MRQRSLFSAPEEEAPWRRVPGLLYVDDFLDAAEERALLQRVDEEPWEDDWKRRIRQYGVGYGGPRGGPTTWVRDFPAWLEALAAKVVDGGYLPRMPDNCVINEYLPGIGIGPHRDYPDFDEPVVAISLGGDIVIDFDEPARGTKVSFEVLARSLWSASGEARWAWRHGIAPRLHDVVDGAKHRRARRVSITFRVARAA